MRIELIYGSNSSGTANVAGLIADALRQAKHTVTLTHARDMAANDVGRADLTILGSCTWERFEGQKKLEGQLQYHMFKLANDLRRRKLTKQRFAIFALGDSTYTEFCHAANELERLVQDVGGQQVLPSLRIDAWFFNQPSNTSAVQDWVTQLQSVIA